MLQPRYYQKQAIDSFFDYTANNWGKHPIIVLPTGAGKSLVQAKIAEKILENSKTRVLFLTHQKKLIEQNHDEFFNLIDNPLIDSGIYSAGLKRRDTKNKVIFAGIQSVYKKSWHLGWFDVILVDECHLIPHKSEGMYRTFLTESEKINKNVVIGGLTATCYRMKEGLLTEGEGALFDDICHETTVKELIDPNHPKNLDKKQYLCNLISKGAINKADLSKVHIRGGEYIPKEMQAAFQVDDLVQKAVREIKEFTPNRNKILVFTAGIEHGESVTQELNSQGLESRMIHSKQSDETNDKNINEFKNGKFRFLVNVDILTTGFNEKSIDCIILLRSTLSPGLYYQIAGRGLRMHESKENCLVLDFGKNVERHGPIDEIEVKKKKDGKSTIATSPQKECPECQMLMHPTIMVCPTCGYEFPASDKHEEKACEKSIISEWKKPEEIEVTDIKYWRHSKKGKPDSLRVDYHYNLYQKYSTWVCIEHEGFPKKKALQWLNNVTEYEVNSVDEALEYCNDFRKPSKIIVNLNGKFPEITGYIFDEEKKEEQSVPIQHEETRTVDEALNQLMF